MFAQDSKGIYEWEVQTSKERKFTHYPRLYLPAQKILVMPWEILAAGAAGGLIRVLLVARKNQAWEKLVPAILASGIIGVMSATALPADACTREEVITGR